MIPIPALLLGGAVLAYEPTRKRLVPIGEAITRTGVSLVAVGAAGVRDVVHAVTTSADDADPPADDSEPSSA